MLNSKLRRTANARVQVRTWEVPSNQKGTAKFWRAENVTKQKISGTWGLVSQLPEKDFKQPSSVHQSSYLARLSMTAKSNLRDHLPRILN